MSFSGDTMQILDYDVYAGNALSCSSEVVATIDARERSCDLIACLNPHSYVLASKTPIFQTALRQSKWLLPDGIGIVMASTVLKGRITRRLTGFDVFWNVSSLLNQRGFGRVFFLGSTEEVLEQMIRNYEQDFPNLTVVGSHSPPFVRRFSDMHNQHMTQMVNSADPDVLWVGMTAPKQEVWLYTNRDQLRVPVAGAIGAVFDFYAGTVRRSPKVFLHLGLEWLPRLIRQPRRLWKRTFLSAPRFLWDVFRNMRKLSGR